MTGLFMSDRINVKFGGFKFLDAAHIKDLLAVLRFVENPRDRVSGFRVLQLVQGVGPASSERTLDYIVTAVDPLGALAYAPRPPRAGEHWTSFLEMIVDLRSGRAGWPAELERARLWYEPHLDRIYDDAVPRRADLIQLAQIAAGYRSSGENQTNESVRDRGTAAQGTDIQGIICLILSTSASYHYWINNNKCLDLDWRRWWSRPGRENPFNCFPAAASKRSKEREPRR